MADAMTNPTTAAIRVKMFIKSLLFTDPDRKAHRQPSFNHVRSALRTYDFNEVIHLEQSWQLTERRKVLPPYSLREPSS
jgi:hypothetical protein